MAKLKNFNTLPSCEGRRRRVVGGVPVIRFQSTPLMRGATKQLDKMPYADVFQSTPLMRGETFALSSNVSAMMISIHSPHARGDRPLAGRKGGRIFQSTPLMRGETRSGGRFPLLCACHFNPLPSCEGRQEKGEKECWIIYFNPLPSCEGRPFSGAIDLFPSSISIRSPHARGDGSC